MDNVVDTDAKLSLAREVGRGAKSKFSFLGKLQLVASCAESNALPPKSFADGMEVGMQRAGRFMQGCQQCW